MTNITYTHCIEQVNDNGELRYSALVRKSIVGGIDGPFTECEAFEGLAEAIASLSSLGFTADTHYKITPRYGSFENGFFATATVTPVA